MQANAPAVPPPVVMDQGQSQRFFAQYPHVSQGNVSYALLQLTVRSSAAELKAVADKLKTEAWASELQKTPEGSTVLGIGLAGRSLQEAITLLGRLKAGEFGKVSVDPAAIPDMAK